MLRAAIAQHWSEDKLAERLTSKLQTWQAGRSEQTAHAAQPQLQPPNAAPSKGKGKLSAKGGASAKAPLGSPAGCEGFTKGKGKGGSQTPSLLQASAKTKPQPPQQHLPRYAAKVAPAEWDSEPTLCTPASLKKALSDGSAVEGNLIVTRDPNCVAEVQALCDAFAYEGELSVATVAEQDLLLPTVNVWWKTGKSPDNRPQRLKLRVTQISTLPGPDVKPPVSVTPQTPGPGEFRQGFLRKDRTDSPEAVISALATLAPCKVSCLTGGRWLQTQDKASKVLTAFLRVPQEVGEALAKVSGQKGLFCTVLDKNSDRLSSPIVWVPKQSSTSQEECFRFASAQAQKQDRPLAFRQGGKT